VSTVERFFAELAGGIITAGGTARFDEAGARALAEKAWQELQAVGTDAYPCLVELEGLRFVYQWDEVPPVLTVMLWDDQMWRDMARVVVPPELTD
jgi:hypothetical protein